MKKEIKITNPDGSILVYKISNEPITSIDLVENATKGYIASLRNNESFSPDTQLSRSICLEVARVSLPAKYTTTIRD